MKKIVLQKRCFLFTAIAFIVLLSSACNQTKKNNKKNPSYYYIEEYYGFDNKIHCDSLDSINAFIDKFYYRLEYDSLYSSNAYKGVLMLENHLKDKNADIKKLIVQSYEELNDSIIIFNMGHLHEYIIGYLIKKKERETGEKMIPMTGNPGNYEKTFCVNINSGNIDEYIYQ